MKNWGRMPGQVTVFVSAALFMILTLLCTSLESARVSAFRYYLKTAADSAVFSVFSNYHRELLDRYHLFFLEDNGRLAQEAETFLTYYGQPDQGLLTGGTHFFRFQTESVQLSDCVYAMDDGGRPFREEILEYMKYGLVETAAEQVRDKLDTAQQCSEVMNITKQLMPLAGQVFELENQYVQLKEHTEGISAAAVRTEQELQTVQELLEEQEKQQGKIDELEKQAASASGAQQLAGQLQVQAEKLELKGITDRLDTAVSQAEQNRKILLQLADDSDGCLKQIQEKTESLKENFTPVAAEIEEMLPRLTGVMRGAAREQADSITAYTEDSGERKKLADQTGEKLSALTAFLQENTIPELLEEINESEKKEEEKAGNEGEKTEEGEEAKQQPDGDDQLTDCLSQLREKGENLWPDQLETAEEPMETGLLDQVKELIAHGVIGLVIGEEERLSDRQIEEEELPSIAIRQEEDETGAAEPGAQAETDGSGILDSLYETAAFNEYIIQVMPSYRDSMESEEGGSYDLEYVLGTGSTDRENLGEALEKLLLLRGGMNLVYLMGDEEKKAEAGAAAAAVTGILGLAPLTELVKWLILAAWALAEAVTDVRALVQGDTVSFIKSSSEWNTALFAEKGAEAFLETEKENMASSGQSGGSGMDYLAYIRILLYLTPQDRKLYRCMDMVQWNIRRNDPDFSLSRCIYQAVLWAEVQAEQIFITLPFAGYGLSASGYRFTVSADRSYPGSDSSAK